MAKHRLLGKIDLMSPIQRVDISLKDKQEITNFRKSIAKTLGTKFYELPDNWREDDSIIRLLFRKYSRYFVFWYYPGLLDITKWSRELAMVSNNGEFFEYWWDPDLFDWNQFNYLATYNSRYFSHWWDPNKIKTRDYYPLIRHCNSMFDVWWDKNNYPITLTSYLDLIRYCSANFDTWWDPDIFFMDQDFYMRCVSEFVLRCKDKFHIWWNPDLFDYSIFPETFLLELREYFYYWFDKDKIPSRIWDIYSWLFAKYFPDQFLDWFDKNKFNYAENTLKSKTRRRNRKEIGRFYLMQHCSDYFEHWWDRRRIRPTEENLQFLDDFCQDHRKFWGKDYIVYQLEGEKNE